MLFLLVTLYIQYYLLTDIIKYSNKQIIQWSYNKIQQRLVIKFTIKAIESAEAFNFTASCICA